jgi:hypothetical protein
LDADSLACPAATGYTRGMSMQIGFTTARYFATVFNEHDHCTPQQFRE